VIIRIILSKQSIIVLLYYITQVFL